VPSYVTAAELVQLAASANLIDSFAEEELDAAMDAASSEADCYLSAAYTTPLTTVPTALKLHVARAAVYHLLSARGFSPEGDAPVERNYERALDFYKALQKSQQNIPEEASAPDRDESVVVVSSRARRDW
jgi:phage gp36-like protein